ncbi:MAG: nickel-dependent hydrogenase large subunit [Burkholderiales bacterium]|nr:nickel-dependent hydrogenase large subunit [Burkholderiales bacterium]
MSRVLLGPFNRVEGDLEISIEVLGGKVASAQVNSPLFRGFEQLLVGRPPHDALTIVPRICGICSVAQSAAAAAALAALCGVQAPPNGRLAAHLVQAAENLADHVTHFYLFFMPDFTRSQYATRGWYAGAAARFMAGQGSAAAPALAARANLLKLMGFMAGRWPHSLALQAGGSTKAITASERVRIQALLRDFRAFVETTLIGDTLEHFAQIDSEDALRAWAAGRSGDFAQFLQLAFDLGLEKIGCAADRFLSYGAYDLWPSGVWQPGLGVEPLEPQRITEDTRHAWLSGSAPLSPAEGQTVVDVDKTDAYTWCKAPRYGAQVAETGALARQMVAGQPLLRDLVQRHGASVSARMVARMVELARVLPAMEQWLRDITLGEAFYQSSELPHSGQGVGLVEAARGGLGHWISVKDGQIERYQIIAPTTWNFSPRDTRGQPGPLELALVGLPAGEGAEPTIEHVVRSFDPCMVCTVH